ncbi:MAG: GatB/YqeY domain-containing protein [Chloroflexi bacterium]|nr:MAG: GatB/YqeY domain-containing protein [Chloroflexota bacterium]
MTLREQIGEQLTAAMRSGDVLRRDTLRMATNAAYNAEKRQQRPLTEEELVSVLAREVKTRRESVGAFRAGGREDLAAKEEAEIAILSEFMPQPLSDAELRSLVDEAITATGGSSPRDMGRVMGWLTPRTRGRADGKLVSTLVSDRLAAADVASRG